MQLEENIYKYNLYKIIILFIILILLFTSCTRNQNIVEKGIDELIEYDIPENYVQESNQVFSDNGKLISTFYGDGNSSICFIILSYNGKAVMGSDETIEEWYNSNDNIADTFSIEGANSDVYIYPVGKDSKEENRYVIEGVFDYDNYLIMVGLDSDEGKPALNDEKISMYYDLLASIKIK